MGDSFIGMLRQITEKIQLLRSQMVSRSSTRYCSSTKVYCQVANTNSTGRGLGNRYPSKRGAYTGEKLRRAEWLRNEIVCTSVKRFHLSGFRVVDGQHNDRNVRVDANCPTRGQTTHSRHVNVEEHQIRAEIAQFAQRLLASFRVIHFIATAR